MIEALRASAKTSRPRTLNRATWKVNPSGMELAWNATRTAPAVWGSRPPPSARRSRPFVAPLLVGGDMEGKPSKASDLFRKQCAPRKRREVRVLFLPPDHGS